MEETDTVMAEVRGGSRGPPKDPILDPPLAEVDRVSQQYLPLSTSCSAMYFTLESLNQ
uniref:Uncharacterized protein n=1 Tax=Amphimedon queenslandica TaxID=400682 RepID=A0A1X7SJX3_AMPQE